MSRLLPRRRSAAVEEDLAPRASMSTSPQGAPRIRSGTLSEEKLSPQSSTSYDRFGFSRSMSEVAAEETFLKGYSARQSLDATFNV